MARLLVNPATQKLLDAYLKAPAHALCITGDVGSGTGSTAVWLAEQLADSPQLVTHIVPEKGLIPIDRIRQLYEQTRSIQQSKRCIVIDDADTMSHDAQNALLKLLEEPVENIHFILTTHHEMQLLPTIKSRTQMIQLLPLTMAQSQELVTNYSLDETVTRQVLFLASGHPAELTRLAENEEYFTNRSVIVTDARTFLQTDDYGRLVIIKKYTDRTNALEFLGMCAKLLSFSLLKQRNYSAADVMEVLDAVMRRIGANGHVRTHLMHLVTKLP
jgi:replication-associated recombination protein RarA